MRLLSLWFEAEIRCRARPVLLASAACRGVPAPSAGGPSAAKNKRRRVPFRVPSFVLVALRRRRWRGPPAGTPRCAPLVLDGALSRARLLYELIRVLRLEKRKRSGGALAAAAGSRLCYSNATGAGKLSASRLASDPLTTEINVDYLRRFQQERTIAGGRGIHEFIAVS